MARSDSLWRRALLVLVAFLCVLVPYLSWRQTWFGRPLGDGEMRQYLYDEGRPRRIQHALARISERLDGGDSSVGRWYPRVLELARHPNAKIRLTAAWVMGQDNSSPEFHRALRALLADPDVMVRRNAALALVRFSDAGGRGELSGMLRPHLVRAPQSGRVQVPCEPGQKVETGTLLARLEGNHEARSPFSGQVDRVFVRDGSQVARGEPLISIASGADQVWEALRALYYVGAAEDLPDVERYRQSRAGFPERVSRQAVMTAQAIRSRAEHTATR